MKQLNIILAVIVILLSAVTFRLFYLGVICERFSEQAQFLLSANQSLIAANQGLQAEIAALRKQLGELSGSLLQKTGKL